MGCLSLNRMKSKPEEKYDPTNKVNFSNGEIDLIKKMEDGVNKRYQQRYEAVKMHSSWESSHGNQDSNSLYIDEEVKEEP